MKTESLPPKFYFGMFGVVVAIAVLYSMFYRQTATEIIVTIKDKEAITNSEGGSSGYRIFCEEEVLSNQDSVLFGKWDSSDIYKDMEEGKKYKVKVSGWRIPFLSSYRNIVEIKGVVE